jgi:peptidoglycan/xylan/chitin deacetylase (PgdA/CDA1 family)
MYHAFSQDELAGRFVLPIRRFSRQMAWLKLMGYHVLGLEQLLTYRREFRLPPSQSVVITIDDGYADTHRLAWPILRRYGFAATVFLVTAAIGGTNQWASSAELKGRPLLSWPDIKEMLRDGIKFGAHTRTHPVLVASPPTRVQEEVEGSKAELERQLNTSVGVFAYPFGE